MKNVNWTDGPGREAPAKPSLQNWIEMEKPALTRLSTAADLLYSNTKLVTFDIP